MFKKGLMLLLIPLFLLGGCSNVTGKAEFNRNISMMEKCLDNDQWDDLEEQVSMLKEIYDEQLWKLQLLGDEGEYEGLNESLNRLMQSINQRDKIHAKLELATIKTIIHDIYTL